VRWRCSSSVCAVAVAAAALAACGGDSDGSAKPDPLPPKLERLFDYDRSVPLDVRRGRRLAYRGIVVTELSYAAPGGRVPALLVRPAHGRHPAAIFMHGSGGSRIDFLAEGVLLAARGVVALTITSPFELEPGLPERVATNRRLTIRNVIDLRRAIDLLQARDDVDPHRIALVGYSRGAQAVVLTAATEDRLRALIVQAGRARASRVYSSPGDLDTVRFVAHVAPARVLFQGATLDELIPRQDMQELIRLAPGRPEVRWYPTGHGFDAHAFRYQVTWLVRVLNGRGGGR
jgi:dienelactone hydrolase